MIVFGEVRWGLFKQRGRGSEGERLRGGMGEIESVKQRERDCGQREIEI